MRQFFQNIIQRVRNWANIQFELVSYRHVLWGMLALSIIPFIGAPMAWLLAGEVKNKEKYYGFAGFFLLCTIISIGSYIVPVYDNATHSNLYGLWTNYLLIFFLALNYLLIFFYRNEIVNEPVSEATTIDEMDAKARMEVQKARRKINVARTPINEIIKEQENIVSYGNIYGVQSTILNINSATLGQIEALPRVGKTLALTILQNRQHFGEFTSLDELCRRCSVKPHIRIAMEPLVSFTTFSGENFKQERRGRRID